MLCPLAAESRAMGVLRRVRPRVPLPPAVRLLGLAGVLGTAAHAVTATTGLGAAFGDTYLHGALMAVAVAIAALRARRGPERGVWMTLTAALGAWAAGETYYLAVEPAGASLADVGYLISYPLFAAVVVQLIRRRVTAIRREMWLDGLTCTLTIVAVGAAVGQFWAGQADPAVSALTVAVNLGFEFADVSLLAIAMSVSAIIGLRDRTFLALAGGFALFAICDLVYLSGVADGTYALGGAIDPGWTAALLLMALAGWQPARAMERAPGVRRLALPVVFATVSVGLLAFDHWVAVDPIAIALAALALLCVLARIVLTFGQELRTVTRMREQASTDALTGLPNRRQLQLDLARAAADGARSRLVVFDLNGFKAYNDTFGHPAGDALLFRLGRRLAEALEGIARPYRIGGDEFCLLAAADHGHRPVELALDALSDDPGGLPISATWGAATLGEEVSDPVRAMTLADQRMYDRKRSGRMPVQRQVREALLAVLHERCPELRDESAQAAELARAVAVRLRAGTADVEEIAHAAALQAIGKTVLPDSVLGAAGPLDGEAWRLVEQHTAVAARILRAAPAMRGVAELVRFAQERHDGTGYPAALAGEDIPLGARIVAVVQAYGAMTHERPYGPPLTPAEALAELRRCAGTQFDPAVVGAFEDVVRAGVLPLAVHGDTGEHPVASGA
jgi:diguanylate cyclase (GGDEF)-like protein